MADPRKAREERVRSPGQRTTEIEGWGASPEPGVKVESSNKGERELLDGGAFSISEYCQDTPFACYGTHPCKPKQHCGKLNSSETAQSTRRWHG